MTENCNFSRTLLRRVATAASVLALAAASYPALAQSDATATDATATDSGHAYSSSTDWKAYLDSGDALDGAAAPTPAPKPGGQYGQSNNHYPGYENRWSHLAFEGGGGFTAPVGNDVRDGYDTWGYNITAGAGWNFTKHFGALLEYQFNRNKIPGATLAAVGAPGGNINTWSFTIDPIFYLPITKKFGGYVTGGGGFYRKVTNFTAPEEEEFCSFFCEIGTENVTIGHFSSNQGGLNLGVGGYWKAFGEDSNAKLYAEARYVWVDSPAATATQNGEGSEGLIPVTFGVRF
ncbi:hypothetical protein HNQ77_004028 [Silvibacterium bohemicum]|uniref:Outer membrane protein beta-barrel domain-containing protein n=1 Tax=Silvibacterium bohemicum TaxID=1577686 RepID=A0A841K643_9BACT|nr:hypothetical protein [Silvibacterium bohemicum]MBB6146058.1 hypothetical protein [Silvibacterium bohemicum]